MSSRRYAIYYTPPPFSALARFGAGVIGYDCFEGKEVLHLLARLYGSSAEALRNWRAMPLHRDQQGGRGQLASAVRRTLVASFGDHEVPGLQRTRQVGQRQV